MHKLQELIDKLCSKGVEYKSLDKVCSISTGSQLNKNKLLEDAEYPVINGGINPSGYWHEYNTEGNTITISQGGASAGFVNYMNNPFWAGAHCYIVKLEDNNVNYKYLYHYIKSIEKKLQQCQQGAGIPSVNRKTIYENRIPVPPLEVQSEIVYILDNFAALTAELTIKLTEELTARQRQYAFYKDCIFNNSNIIMEHKTLKELAENCDNQRKPITSGNRVKGDIPYYGASGIVDYVKDYIFDGNYLLISEDGANLTARKTPIAFSITGKNWVNNHAHVLKFDNEFIQKYVEMYLNSLDLKPFITGAAQPKLNQENLNKITIPLPRIEILENNVKLLSKFDEMISDILEKLPNEIEKRQKQYEYYRDRLLCFKEVEADE